MNDEISTFYVVSQTRISFSTNSVPRILAPDMPFSLKKNAVQHSLTYLIGNNLQKSCLTHNNKSVANNVWTSKGN